MLCLKIRPIRTKTAIWYELNCNISTQTSTVVVSTGHYLGQYLMVTNNIWVLIIGMDRGKNFGGGRGYFCHGLQKSWDTPALKIEPSAENVRLPRMVLQHVGLRSIVMDDGQSLKSTVSPLNICETVAPQI